MDDSSDEDSDLVAESAEGGLAANKDCAQVHTEGKGDSTGTSPSTHRIIRRRLSENIHPQIDTMNAFLSGCQVVLLPLQGGSIVSFSVVSRDEYMREPTQRSRKGRQTFDNKRYKERVATNLLRSLVKALDNSAVTEAVRKVLDIKQIGEEEGRAGASSARTSAASTERNRLKVIKGNASRLKRSTNAHVEESL